MHHDIISKCLQGLPHRGVHARSPRLLLIVCVRVCTDVYREKWKLINGGGGEYFSPGEKVKMIYCLGNLGTPPPPPPPVKVNHSGGGNGALS